MYVLINVRWEVIIHANNGVLNKKTGAL